MQESLIRKKNIIFAKIANKFAFLTNFKSTFYFFILLLACGIGYFALTLFTNSWVVTFGGDFTQEQIPFYYNGWDDWHTFFSTGKFPMWDESIFLGVDNIASNSFYYLFSPFFFLILLFPRALIPQGIACIMIIKLACAGMTMRLFLKYMGLKESVARIGAVAYAMCGWMTFYLWYNHFMEVAVFFPVILLGIERVIKERKPTVLIIGLFLLGISNYFFFITACIFGVIYALFRFFQTIKTRNKKENLLVMVFGIGGFAVGIMCAAFVLLPGIITAASAPRADSSYLSNLQNALLAQDFGKMMEIIFTDWGGVSARVYYPILSFLFPVTDQRHCSLLIRGSFDGSVNVCSSLFIFTPLMLMLIPAIIDSARRGKISHFIVIAFYAFALFTPFCYYFFHAFAGTEGYGRWQIVVVIPLIFYTCSMLQNRKSIPKWNIGVSYIVILGLMIFAFFLAQNLLSQSSLDMGEQVYVAIYEMIWLTVVAGIMIFKWKDINFNKIILSIVCVEAVICGNITQGFHGVISYTNSSNGGSANVAAETKVISNINDQDDTFFRIMSTRAYQGNENIPLVEGYNGLSAFHSLYNFNLKEFLTYSHIFKSDTTWIGGTQAKRFYLETFLGVKYYVTKDSDTTTYYTNNTSIFTEPNIPYGYERIDDKTADDGYRVYKNNNWIELGFSYDTLYKKGDTTTNGSVTFNDFNTTANYTTEVIRNDEAYLTGAILDNEIVDSLVDSYGDSTFEVKSAPSLEASKIATKATFYAMNTAFSVSNPNGYLSTSSYDNASGVDGLADADVNGQKTIMVITNRTSGNLTLATLGSYLLMNLPLTHQYESKIYLIDQNDQIISWDKHTNPDSSYKYWRGFYANQIIKKIILVPYGTSFSKGTMSGGFYSGPSIYETTNVKIQNRIDSLKSYPLENVTYDVNEYSFETSFVNNRFICLQIPYSDGWSVRAVSSSGEITYPKIYSTQGGFIGFVSEKGNTSYTCYFKTTHIDEAAIISLTGFLLFGGYLAAAAVIEMKRKPSTRLG